MQKLKQQATLWRHCLAMTVSRRHFLRAAGAGLLVPPLAACSDIDKLPVGSVPTSAFDDDSTAEEVTEGHDLRGKLAVVTGCTTGIGFETMRVLAMRGEIGRAHV